MRASKRSLKGLLALLVLATMIVPGMASAAAPNPVSSVIVFGNKVPEFAPWGVVGDPGWNDPAKGYNTVFANSKPFDQVSFGGVYYMGVADPDVIIDIQFTDGVNTFNTSTWTAPTGSTVAIDGYNAGWFGLWVPSGFPRPTQDDRNVIYVTDLGVHKAEVDLAINPDGSASTNPAHWGPSPITFKFTARNPATNEVSATVTRQITKYAGTPDDVTKPIVLSNIKYPPAHWCHTAGPGANLRGGRFSGSQSPTLGATAEGGCSSVVAPRNGPFPGAAVPDVTWVLCTRELSEPQDFLLGSGPVPTDPGDNGPLDPVEALVNSLTPAPFPDLDFASDGDGRPNDNPFRQFYCRFRPSEHTPRGEAPIQGVFTDVPAASRGIGSEIAGITVKVFQGSNLFLDLTPKITEFRAGPQYGFSHTLKIQDLEPNYPLGELYQIRIEVTDAWGNVTPFTSPDITVYPY